MLRILDSPNFVTDVMSLLASRHEWELSNNMSGAWLGFHTWTVAGFALRLCQTSLAFNLKHSLVSLVQSLGVPVLVHDRLYYGL